jgi:hypothetical protein
VFKLNFTNFKPCVTIYLWFNYNTNHPLRIYSKLQFINMNNKNLKELYELFLINITEKHIKPNDKMNRYIERYLDKSILYNYESSYSNFSYIYDIEIPT